MSETQTISTVAAAGTISATGTKAAHDPLFSAASTFAPIPSFHHTVMPPPGTSAATVAQTGTVDHAGTITHPGTLGHAPTITNSATIFQPGAVAHEGTLSLGVTLASPGTIGVAQHHSEAPSVAAGTVASVGTVAAAGSVAASGTVAATGTTAQTGSVTAATASSGTIFYVVTDPTTGAIRQRGHMPAMDGVAALKAMNATQISAEQFEQVRRAAGKVALVNGQIQPMASAAINVSAAQASSNAQVDKAAANALNMMLPGIGQTIEWIATFQEARAIAAATDPLDATKYPFLGVDVAIQVAAGKTYTLRDAASDFVAYALTWQTYAVAVKQAKLQAKAAIAAATTPTAMQTIINAIKWPTPPTPPAATPAASTAGATNA